MTNEMMSFEELDQVAGGRYNQTAGDSRFLNDLGGYCDRFGATRTFFDEAAISKKVVAAWAKFGITLKSKWYSQNSYYHNGKEIFREEAMLIACKAVGKRYRDVISTESYK